MPILFVCLQIRILANSAARQIDCLDAPGRFRSQPEHDRASGLVDKHNQLSQCMGMGH
jgi:hypothetical protein